MIVIPNIDQIYTSYKIESNTAYALTVAEAIDETLVSSGNDFVISYGKLIRTPINRNRIAVYPDAAAPYDDALYPGDPGFPKTVSGEATVKFFRPIGLNSFADNDATYDGVCQVCHTETNYHQNDGGGDFHNAEANCTECHNHANGFMHGGGSEGCSQCHGHDAGSNYDLDMMFPNDESETEPAHIGTGSSWSHSTHTESDGDDQIGPQVYCDACHNIASMPAFKDNLGLDQTEVCNPCHSTGGTYDGVAMAKANWHNDLDDNSSVGIYKSDRTLKTGQEKWCATCHDEDPANSMADDSGIDAPNVVGDEDQNTNYGIGYGYYKTGHGLAQGIYPASGAPAANIGCCDCHDASQPHIDGEHRTYEVDESTEPDQVVNAYSESNRRKEINDEASMVVPRKEWAMPVTDFALCFECHDSDIYLNNGNYTTNFRNDSTSVNSHWYHLQGVGSHTNRWDSDWDGATGESFISCPACHNVHGSPSPAMIRHGELISTSETTDKVPALGFQYTPANTYPTLDESTGGMMRFIPFGPGTIANNGVCNMCHNNNYPYTRTSTDMYPPKISFVYGEVGSDQVTVTFSEGVYGGAGSDALDADDFNLTDSDNGRTVSSVIEHTAGQDYAVLTLSSDLDSENDINTDTLAAVAASIYDSSGNYTDTTPVVISGDSDAPYIFIIDPKDGENDIALNRDLTFVLADNGIGIDWTIFEIQLSGLGYDEGYTDTDTAVVSKTGSPPAYKVTVAPEVFYGAGEEITVTVDVADLTGNSTQLEWSFTAADTEIWETPEAVYDSLFLGSPGNLIDDSPSTGNGFGPGGPNHYATFTLDDSGDLYTVTDVRLYGRTGYTSPSGWRVYTSLDGYTFTHIGTWIVGGADQWFEYTFPAPATTRYLRINDWHPGPESPDAAFEFQFKGTPVVNPNIAPVISWTGEANYETDGVNPDSAIGGTDFTFRVNYTDMDNNAPSLIQLWIDSNDNGSYGSGEKLAMTEVDFGDTVYTDGKLYAISQPLLYAGDGEFNYRFAASDGTDPATGSPTEDSQVNVTNNVPILAWTGETNYTDTGVYPDNVLGGNSFEFRVSYSDVDNTAPSIIQVWIDKNDNNTPDSGETYDLDPVDTDDTDYTDGKIYSKTLTLGYAGDGNLLYRFNGSDGTDVATGTPVLDRTMTIINNVPVLAWTGETHYAADGVYPDSATNGNNFEFRAKYSDMDNTVPSIIQIWVDINDNSSYEAEEKYDLTEMDAGDTDYTDGKLFSTTMALVHAGDGYFNYRFYASDGTVDAVGDPASDNTVIVVTGTNIAPTLSWTGETNYTEDGVNPNVAVEGSDFEFRISYADADNNAPTGDIQVWVDQDDSGTYEGGEKHDMTEMDGDTIYTDGKFYAVTLTLAHAGDARLNYCFAASDGTDVATGTPVFDSLVVATDNDVPAGAAGYWKFEEGSGTIVLDETVNLNDGTIDGPVRTTGRIGNALNFDGTDDFVNVPDSPSLDITDVVTMEAWVKVDTYTGEWNLVLVKGNSSTTRNYGMWVRNTGDILINYYSGGWYSFYPAGQGFTTGVWHHVVGIIDTANDYRAIYIDGELKASDNTTIAALQVNGNPLYMGKVDTKFPLDGTIDEVVIYNRALTEPEIKARYGAWLKAAKARDTSGGGDGIQSGDQVIITFDNATNGAPVDASNIDTFLALDNGHTWQDGSNSIGSAVWSTGALVNDTLTITLSTVSGVPTVSVGDTISLDGTIKDTGLGRSILDSVFLTGSFDNGLPAGAVGFWRFNAGASSIAYDDTSNFNDGSITGAAWTGGKADNGLSFDGSGDSVVVADDVALDITEGLTIEMWIKPAVTYDSSLSTYVVLMDRQRSGGTDSYFLGINSDGKLHLGSYGGNIQSTPISWTAGTWYHVVGTYSDTGGSYSGELYVNGVAETLSVNNYDDMAGGSQVIGIGGSNQFNSFNGVIDEVVIYNRALNATEVLDRYNLYAP